MKELDFWENMERSSATFYLNQRWLVIFRPFGGGAGFTLGKRMFFYDKVLSSTLLAHELVHVEQYQRFGVIGFLLRYLWGLILLRGRPIDRHPLEKPAYEAQRAELDG